MCEKEEFGMGWILDPPDLRDYDKDHPMIAETWKTLPLGNPNSSGNHRIARGDFSPVENQGNLGSCTFIIIV